MWDFAQYFNHGFIHDEHFSFVYSRNKKTDCKTKFTCRSFRELRNILYLIVLFQPEKQSCHGVSVPRDEGIEIATLAVYVLVCCYKRHGGDYSEDKSHPVKQRGQAQGKHTHIFERVTQLIARLSEVCNSDKRHIEDNIGA